MTSVKHVRDDLVYSGRRVTLVRRVLLIDSREVIREVVKFGEAVAMVPLMGDDIILIRQYRSPVRRWIYEIPAGKVEPGEDPEETAKRELIEEIGYEAGKLEHLISIHTTPGYSDEILHIYLATDLREVGARPEPYELIEIVKVPLSKALDLVLSDGVVDAKTALALLMLRAKLGRP